MVISPRGQAERWFGRRARSAPTRRASSLRGAIPISTRDARAPSSSSRRVGSYVDTLRARPDSLLVRYLGAHSLRLHGRVIYFVVMKNVFHGARTLHEK